MAPRTQRGARKVAPSISEYRRLAARLSRVVTLVQRNSNEIEKLREEQKTQFKRFAQVQAELDTIRNAWEKMRGTA